MLVAALGTASPSLSKSFTSFLTFVDYFSSNVNRMKVLLFALLRSFEFELAVPAEVIVPQSAIVTRPYLKDNFERGSQMPLVVKFYKANQ